MTSEYSSSVRCVHVFERKPKGLRYVTARWRCKRKALKGSSYCSYCEPIDEKQVRLSSKRSGA